MNNTQIPKRYARALFELADEMKILPAVEQDMRSIKAACEQVPEFKLMLKSPVMKPVLKKKIITALFEKHFHHLPVVDADGKLAGIITSWDLIKSNKRFEEYGNFKVSDLMTVKVASLGPNDSVGAAAMVFLRHLFHGVPPFYG